MKFKQPKPTIGQRFIFNNIGQRFIFNNSSINFITEITGNFFGVSCDHLVIKNLNHNLYTENKIYLMDSPEFNGNFHYLKNQDKPDASIC